MLKKLAILKKQDVRICEKYFVTVQVFISAVWIVFVMRNFSETPLFEYKRSFYGSSLSP